VYSTVIAARVGDPFLGEAVDSIFTQTLPPSRVEVVTDAGQSIPDEWRSRILDAHPKVSFHVQQGSGLASALSEGTRRVRTPYVAYLDSDDVWFPDKQQRQVQLLEQEEALDAATCRAVNVTLGQEIQEVSGSSSCTFTATTFRTGISQGSETRIRVLVTTSGCTAGGLRRARRASRRERLTTWASSAESMATTRG